MIQLKHVKMIKKIQTQ